MSLPLSEFEMFQNTADWAHQKDNVQLYTIDNFNEWMLVNQWIIRSNFIFVFKSQVIFQPFFLRWQILVVRKNR